MVLSHVSLWQVRHYLRHFIRRSFLINVLHFYSLAGENFEIELTEAQDVWSEGGN